MLSKYQFCRLALSRLTKSFHYWALIYLQSTSHGVIFFSCIILLAARGVWVNKQTSLVDRELNNIIIIKGEGETSTTNRVEFHKNKISRVRRRLRNKKRNKMWWVFTPKELFSSHFNDGTNNTNDPREKESTRRKKEWKQMIVEGCLTATCLCRIITTISHVSLQDICDIELLNNPEEWKFHFLHRFSFTRRQAPLTRKTLSAYKV